MRNLPLVAPKLRPQQLRNFLALAAGLLAIFEPNSCAQRSAAAAAPPQPVPLEVKVRRDRRLEIPLRIYGRQSDTLKFLIRVAPANGKLTEPKAADKESATVIYEPPENLAITHDRFSYAVQSFAGVSAPAEIAITIVDLPPQLTMPDVLEFPATLAGETAAKVLELSNRGGGVATGELEVSAPWRVEGARTYRLASGDLALFKITFAPTQSGTFDNAVRFTSDREHSTSLHGEALAPIAASPAKIMLQTSAPDAVRTGTFELVNQTAEPRTLTLRGGPRLQAPAEVTIPAHGKVAVSVHTLATDVEPLTAELRAEAPGFSLVVPVQATRVGAIIRAVLPSITFGRVSASAPPAGSFALENFGGTATGVSWEIAAPFTVEQNSTVLLPRETKTFALHIPPTKPGTYRAWLKVKAGQQTLDVPVAAELAAEGSAKLSATSAAAANSRTSENAPGIGRENRVEPEAGATPIVASLSADWLSDPIAPRGVKITRLTPAAITFEWPASLSTAAKFRIETRRLSTTENGELAVAWIEQRPSAIQRVGEEWSATLTGLNPAQASVLRILPLNDAGEPGPRLFALDFTAPPAASLAPDVTVFRALLAVAIILILVMTWQRLRRNPR